MTATYGLSCFAILAEMHIKMVLELLLADVVIREP